MFHSAGWAHDHDLTGKRVAVIGTGAPAIQFVPQIQPGVDELHLLQRTALWIMPRRARPLTHIERAVYRPFPAAQKPMRAAIYWGRELYAIPLLRAGFAPVTRMLGRRYLRRQVPDAELRQKLTPVCAPGCKRILISNDYLPSLAQPNVKGVTDPISEVRERSIVTRDGVERDVDTIIFGTGTTSRTFQSPGGFVMAAGAPRVRSGVAAGRRTAAPPSPAFLTCSSCLDLTPGWGTPRSS